MAYSPRGHVPLLIAVERIFDELTAAHKAGYQDCQNELRLSSQQRNGALPKHMTRSLSTPEDIVAFRKRLSERQEVLLREMAEHARVIQVFRTRVLDAIQQEFGEGDVRTVVLSSSGEIIHIPPVAWRSTLGEAALVGQDIFWAQPGYLGGRGGRPFIAEPELEKLRQRLTAIAGTWVTGSSARHTPVSPLAKNRTTRGNVRVAKPIASRRATILTRVVVDQPTADEWMHSSATTAKSAGDSLGRELGITRCQKALNCTRDVARAAYKALPEELKRPRGKPAKQVS